MTTPPTPPSDELSHRVLVVIIAVLVGLLTGFAAGVVAALLHAAALVAAQFAGSTFIAVTLLVLKIRDQLR